MIYLDNAATTPMCNEAVEAMYKSMKENYGNPSSIHAAGRKARASVEQARKDIASHLNANPMEIFFTSCGTESNNTAIKNSVRDLKVNLVITSPVEHSSVLNSLEKLRAEGNIELQFLKIDKTGRVSVKDLENKLKENEDKAILVSIMHANNEIGTVNDIQAIGEICREYSAYFHSDTVQSMAHLPIDLTELQIDFLSGSAHKFHGPKGVGFLYINERVSMHPFIHGGGQERQMRSGTENIAGIVGMQAAFNHMYDDFDAYSEQVNTLRNHFKKRLLSEFEDIQFTGNQEHYLPTVLNVSLPPHPKNKMLIQSLDLKGICASGGSACSSGAQKGSHVLNALYGDGHERSNIRFSFSHFNALSDVDAAIDALKSIIVQTM